MKTLNLIHSLMQSPDSEMARGDLTDRADIGRQDSASIDIFF
jgi:hypothetical protein